MIHNIPYNEINDNKNSCLLALSNELLKCRNIWECLTSVCLVQNKEKTLAVVIWIILTWLCLPVPTLGLSVSVIADCQCCSLQSSFSSAPVLPCLAVWRLLTTVSWNIKTNQSAVHGGRHLWSRTSQQGSDSTRATAEQLWHQNWQLSCLLGCR